MQLNAWSSGSSPSRKGDAAAGDGDGRKGGLGDVRGALRKLQRLEEASRGGGRGGGGQEGVSDAQVRKDARDRLEVASMELWTSQRDEVLQAARSVSAALNVLRIAIDCGALRSESENEVLRLRKKLLEIYMLHRKSLDVENTSAKALVRHKTMCDLATLCVTRMVEAMSPESVDVDLLRDLELLARENVAVGSQSYRLAVRAIHLTDFIIGELGNMYANAGEVPEEDKQSLTPCLRYALKILFRPRKKEILRCSEISLLKGQWLTIPWSEEGKLLCDKSFRSEIEGRLTDMHQRIQVALNGKNGSLESPVPEASVIETELQQLGWEPVPNEHNVWRKHAATSDRIGLDVVRGRAALHALWLRCSAHAMCPVNVKSEPSLESNDTAKALAGNPKGNGKMATVADSGQYVPSPPPPPPLDRQGSTNSIALTQASQVPRWGSSVDAVTCRPESVLVLGAACMAYVGYPDFDTSAEAREQCITFNNAVPGLVKACKEPEAALPAVRALLVGFLEQHLSAGALDCRPGLCKKVVHNVAYLMSLFTAICRASDRGDFKVKCFGLWTQLVAGLKPGLLDDLDVWDLVTAPIFRASNAIAFFKDRATNQVWMATFLFCACDLAESVDQPRVRRSARRDRIIALKDMDIGNPVDVTEVHRSRSMVQRVWETRLELCVHTFVWAKGLDLGTSKYIICEQMVKTYPREGFAAIKRDKQLIKVLGGLTEVLHVLRSLEPNYDASWLWKVVRTWYPGASVLARSLQDSLELLALCLPPSKHARSFNMLVRAADKDNVLVKQMVQSHELLLSVLSHHGFEHPDFSPKHVVSILRELALPIRSKRAEIQTLAMHERNFYAGLALLIEEPSFASAFFRNLFAKGVPAGVRSLLFAAHGETLHEVILLTQRTSRASAIVAAQRDGADDEPPYIDLAACASQDSLVSEPGATRGKALFSYPDVCQRVTIGEDELVRVGKLEDHFTDAIVQFYFQWCMLEKYPSHRAAIERGIFCFDALFFSKMLDSYASTGLDSVHKVVGNWYASLGATIFEKDIWAIPVVHEEHWSLFLVSDVSTKSPCMMHFDSFGCHSQETLQVIFRRFWEKRWRLTHPGGPKPPFLRARTVRPPRQENEHDCGPFICKYFDMLVHDIYVAEWSSLGAQQKKSIGSMLEKRAGPRWFKTVNSQGQTVGKTIRETLRKLMQEKSERAKEKRAALRQGRRGASPSSPRPSARAHTKTLELLVESARGVHGAATREQIWKAVHEVEVSSHARVDGFAEGLVRCFHKLLTNETPTSSLISDLPELFERIGPSALNDVLIRAIAPLLERWENESELRTVCEAFLKRMIRLSYPGSSYEIRDADWTLLGSLLVRARGLVDGSVWRTFVEKCKPPRTLNGPEAQMRMQSKEAVDLFLDESDDEDDARMDEKDNAATLVNEEDENNGEHGTLNVLDDISEKSDHEMDAKKDTEKDTEEKLPAIPTLMADVNEAEVNKAEVASKARKRGLMREDPCDAQELDGNAALRPRSPPWARSPRAKRGRFDALKQTRAQLDSVGLDPSEDPEREHISPQDTRGVKAMLDLIAGDKVKLTNYAERFLVAAEAKWQDLDNVRRGLLLFAGEASTEREGTHHEHIQL